ncbi:hypothetical protein DsansV1_C02g0020011 [Dioscorea sansibarensis]
MGKSSNHVEPEASYGQKGSFTVGSHMIHLDMDQSGKFAPSFPKKMKQINRDGNSSADVREQFADSHWGASSK